jgi:hypothetical protein
LAGSATNGTVSGLTNGTSYTFTVRATNTFATGAASTASNAVMPVGPATSKPDGYFSKSPKGTGGNNSYAALGSGAGGSNDKVGKGPTVSRNKATTVKFSIQNDGSVADTVENVWITGVPSGVSSLDEGDSTSTIAPGTSQQRDIRSRSAAGQPSAATTLSSTCGPTPTRARSIR